MKRPRILVIGSFMMDLVVRAPRAPAKAKPSSGAPLADSPEVKEPTKRLPRLGSEQL